jgi:D-alanyl-D-alanine carboxypeptidase (penicillin-binding protein 5/6)
MKKPVHCIFPFLFFLFFFQFLGAEPLKMSVSADAAILINADTGAILFEKHARGSYYPASITKIATALYGLKKKGTNFDDIAIVEQDCLATISSEKKQRLNYQCPAYWQEPDGTHIGIKIDEQLTLRNLFYGMMVASGNDAANVIGHNVSGSVPQFMNELNVYLKELGCKDTCFLNPHGLHHPEHKTTAYDMALITREALKIPEFREIVATVRYTRPKTNKQESTVLVQGNKLLRQGQHYYPKAIGVKTGYHSRALHTFVGAAQQDGRTLIAVFLHAKERNDLFKDSIKLFETAFNQPKVKRLLMKAGPQKYALHLKGAVKPAKTFLKEDLTLVYYPAEEPQIKALVFWDQVPLPIAQGQRLGEVRIISSENNIIQTAPIFSQNEVKESWLHWIKQRIERSFGTSPWIISGSLILVFLIASGFVLKRRRAS